MTKKVNQFRNNNIQLKCFIIFSSSISKLPLSPTLPAVKPSILARQSRVQYSVVYCPDSTWHSIVYNQAVHGIVQYNIQAVNCIVYYIIHAVHGIVQYIIQAVHGIVQYIVQAVHGIVQYIIQAVHGIVQYIINTVHGIVQYIFQAVHNIV